MLKYMYYFSSRTYVPTCASTCVKFDAPTCVPNAQVLVLYTDTDLVIINLTYVTDMCVFVLEFI